MKQTKKDLKEAKKTFETEQKDALKELKDTAKNATSAMGFEVAKEKVMAATEEAMGKAMEKFANVSMMMDMMDSKGGFDVDAWFKDLDTKFADSFGGGSNKPANSTTT
jgi:myo-inositol catabolism protein IolC